MSSLVLLALDKLVLMLLVSFIFLLAGVVTDPDFFSSPLPSRKKRQDSPAPVPPSIDQLNITEEMIEFCNNMTACLYDFAVTGSIEIAKETRDFDVNTTLLEEQLGMKMIGYFCLYQILHVWYPNF